MEACVATPPSACTSSPATPSPAEEEVYEARPRRTEQQKDPDEACKVIVTGYPAYTRAEDLVLVLTKFGTVTVSRKGRTEAVMAFGNEQEAKEALKGSKTLLVYGEHLIIKPYTPNSPEKHKGNKREFPKSKAKGMIIEPKDIDLSGDFYQQVDRIMAAVRLTQEDVNTLSAVYGDLEHVLQVIWPGCQALPFGSITTGLGIKTSDADCFILLPPQFRHPSGNFVNKTKKLLQLYPRLFAEIISIPRANTPIVKFFHVPTRTNCDVSFKTTLGVQNSKLIAFLLHADPRLIPLAVVLKYWAKVHALSGTGKITNYALTMMIIFYLQQLPMSILPSVEWLQRDRANDFYVDSWNTGFMGRRELLPPTSNTSSLSELLGGFFEFYSSFNFEEMVVCPYLGKAIKKDAFNDLDVLPEAFQLYKNNMINKLALPLRNDTAMCVQDPVEQSHNVASAITSRMASEIKAYYKFAANAYDKEKLNGCENFVRVILHQKPKLPRNRAYPEFRVMLFPKTLLKIEDEDWKTVVRDIVFVIYEKMLKIKLGKLEETINAETKKEREKYAGVLTKAIWKRRRFTKLYDSMGLNIETKHEMITQEVMKVDKEQFDIKFQLTLTFCHNPRNVVMATRLSTGDIDGYRDFGKFLISVKLGWFEELLKPYVRVKDKNIKEQVFVNTKLLNGVSLSDTSEVDPLRQIIDTEQYSDDSS